jgi:hypothetical protein
MPKPLQALTFTLIFASVAFAQQPIPSSSTLPDAPAAQSGDSESDLQKQEQSQRVLGVIPHFGVTSRQNAAPLSSGQKFKLFYRSSLDPMMFVIYGLQAGLSQGENEFPAYGQGAEGYAKYYGSTMADGVSGNFFSNFFYPVLLKQDPRFFRSGEGPFGKRLKHALAQEFVAHRDAGGITFNWSNTLGAFSSGALSNVYYPSDDRGFGLTMSRSAIQIAYGSMGGILNEFWPDIQKKLKKNKPPQN